MSGGSGAHPVRLKIAVVVPKYGLVGGGERFVFELTERMAVDGRYEFHVYANRWRAGSANVVFHKVPMVRFPRSLRSWSFAWAADRMISADRCDIVHAHERVFRADVVSMHFVPHAGWVRDVRKKRASLFDRAVIRLERKMMNDSRGAWWLPVSSLAAAALRREYPVDPARVRVVPPGVDVARFASPDRDACRAEIRERHGIGPSDLLVLFVGMNFEVKGLSAIVAAVAKARDARPEAGIRLLVVGRGDEEKYRDLARAHGIADAVTFAGAHAEGVERYYRAADVFMMLSAFDTFGMAVLEAMAAGLPVIVSPNVGARDVVEEGAGGFVLSDGNDADEAAGRIALLTDPRRLGAMGEAASRAAGRSAWESVSGEMSRIYEAVLADPDAPGRLTGRRGIL